MIPISHFSKSFTFEQLLEIPQIPLSQDWYSEAIAIAPTFSLAISNSQVGLVCSVAAAPNCDRALAVNQFQPELWKMDVAELFIKEDSGERYQEFNLSPVGAWWSNSFAKIRVEDTRGFKMLAGVSCYSKVTAQSWQAGIIIPRHELSVLCSFKETSRINVNFILGSPQRFFSWAKISKPKPDFHQPDFFEKVKVKQLA